MIPQGLGIDLVDWQPEMNSSENILPGRNKINSEEIHWASEYMTFPFTSKIASEMPVPHSLGKYF